MALRTHKRSAMAAIPLQLPLGSIKNNLLHTNGYFKAIKKLSGFVEAGMCKFTSTVMQYATKYISKNLKVAVYKTA